MNAAERERQYREQWVSFLSATNELGDRASVEAAARHLNPWAGHQSIWGYTYNASTAKTRALFCALRWNIYFHARNHSIKCFAHFRAALDTVLEVGDAIEAFEKAHPHHCRQCGGAGWQHEPGVYRYPDGSSEPPSDEPCEGCVGQGRCPLCGTQHDEDWEGESCPCGYTCDARETAPSWDQARDLECVCGGE